VFTELARRTRDERYTRLVKRVGDLGFDAQGNMLEAMPYHGEYSDAIFMGTVIAAQAGSLTGERKYYDFAARHLAFMRRLVQRPDGLYRHIPAVDAAWGRGNAFAALGLTLTLDELPMDHPERESILAAYRDLMAKLLPYQMPEGTWRNVIDYPGAYAEYSATAMFGFAMLRGVRRGWLPAEPYRNAIERAWQAVLVRTGPEGQLVNVCESTPRMPSLEAYVQRAAVFGTDPRGGAMALLFATEMAGLE
jgi:unsaturated rhamnogalacturonyl hydrolase